jgi:putative chitobiose transport system permease protein
MVLPFPLTRGAIKVTMPVKRTSSLVSRKKMAKNTLIAYAFMAPALVVLLVFVVYPILFSLPLGLFSYTAMTPPKFIGFDNFRKAFADREFWIAMYNSARFVLVVPILQLLSIALAVVANQKIRGITVYRTLFYIPVVTSMIAISIMWKFLFERDGVINTLLRNAGMISKPIYFLLDKKLAMPSLMFVTIWQGLGYYMMLYLAGLQSVPSNLVEAARIDGASGRVAFFRITIPMLKPYIWFCSLFSVLSALGVFDVVFAMTKGGPSNSTLVMSYYTYQEAFHKFRYGYAAAAGMAMSVVTTAFSTIVFLYGKRGGMSHDE